MTIYEIVDVTSEEQYFTLGVVSTLEDALGILAECREPCDVPCDDSDSGESILEVRERRIGHIDLYCLGKTVYRVQFTERHDAVTDDYVWDRTDQCGTCVARS